MNTKYKITLWSISSPLILPIFLFFLMLIVWLKLIIVLLNDKNYAIIGFILVLIIFEIVPSIILQFNYLKIDKNKIIKIDENKFNIEITQNGKKNVFHFDEVDRVRMIHSKNYDNVFRGLMPWYTYYFYVICLKNDDEYIVTRLSVRKLEKIINVRIVYKRVFFPYITKIVLNRAINK
jgi:hypothetical protein